MKRPRVMLPASYILDTAEILSRPIGLHNVPWWLRNLPKFSKADLYADDTKVSLSSDELGDMTQNFQRELENIFRTDENE